MPEESEPQPASLDELEELPTEQLKLILEEVVRGREAVTARIESFRTRAAVLVTSSGILTVLLGSKQMAWPSFVSVGLFFVSAVIGVVILVPSKGAEVHVSELKTDWLKKSEHDLADTIFKANDWVVQDEMKKAAWMGHWLTVGYIVMVAAWIFAFIGSAF